MKNVSLLAVNLNFTQWIVLGVAVFVTVVLFAVLFYNIYRMVAKPELKYEIATMEKAFKQERKRIIAEKENAKAEIRRSEKAANIKPIDLETERMRRELMQQGLHEEKAKEIADMTLENLLTLKEREREDLSGDFIINAVTRKVLIDSEFEQREDIEDFKVPVNQAAECTAEEVEHYFISLSDVTQIPAKGKTADTYKVSGKAFALLNNLGEGKFRLTIKCGPFYGQRLCQLYPEFFRESVFPYGMIWFSADNLSNGSDAGRCSLELVKLLGLISYNIAKAGY